MWATSSDIRHDYRYAASTQPVRTERPPFDTRKPRSEASHLCVPGAATANAKRNAPP